MAESKKILSHNLVSGPKYGYRNREDVTTLPPNVLIKGSQNVLTTVRNTVRTRNGYTLDGQADATGTLGIFGSFDWDNNRGTEHHLRAVRNSLGAKDGKLQFRYVANAGDIIGSDTLTEGEVRWIDIFDELADYSPSFCTFWDFDNEVQDLLLFVDGYTAKLHMWTGGVATVNAVTANTIKGNFPVGVSWASAGFSSSGTWARKVIIDGNVYSYTGGEGTDTLTGVTPDPSGEAANSVVFQMVQTFAAADLTGVPTAFIKSHIANLNNQIYLGSRTDNSAYVSKVNSFLDYSFTSPARVNGEGAVLTLDGTVNGFFPGSDTMLISAGKRWWYKTAFTYGADNIVEALDIDPIKSANLQAVREEHLMDSIGNRVAFISFENQMNTIGFEPDVSDERIKDLSYTVVNDMQSLDFSGGHLKYHNKYAYLSAPNDGVVMVYNMTNDASDTLSQESTHYWEPPQTLPISRFSIIGGELYGHHSGKAETYRLFRGTNDNGNPIFSKVSFAFNQYGDRTSRKTSTEFYVEGLKTQTTRLKGTLTAGVGGTERSYEWEELPARNFTEQPDDASIGKMSIGKVPIGSSVLDTPLISRFRLIETFDPFPFYEEQVSFASDGLNQIWEIIAFATNATLASEGNNAIKDPNSGEMN